MREGCCCRASSGAGDFASEGRTLVARRRRSSCDSASSRERRSDRPRSGHVARPPMGRAAAAAASGTARGGGRARERERGRRSLARGARRRPRGRAARITHSRSGRVHGRPGACRTKAALTRAAATRTLRPPSLATRETRACERTDESPKARQFSQSSSFVGAKSFRRSFG